MKKTASLISLILICSFLVSAMAPFFQDPELGNQPSMISDIPDNMQMLENSDPVEIGTSWRLLGLPDYWHSQQHSVPPRTMPIQLSDAYSLSTTLSKGSAIL